MAIILLIAIGVLVLIMGVSTLVQVARDGYHAAPTRDDLLQRL
ncbi:hypothetical protein [Microbacterium terricola]|uniref:Uncharacterized protein n=1 Tax=Microbacterium terricola TaxID=344163 RepID=A0ABM8E2I2_9MICO|nr:hypothetical protein [Microbacterium terricola]UYK40364.1 hypothetical protein OAU46_01555 [Microbacterium terricola]BDV31921.1 hypothetical protein Microterr_25810 [Microbacterium terricola]